MYNMKDSRVVQPIKWYKQSSGRG